MKHIANIISMSRVILSIVLFFSFGNGLLFSVLYLICGSSDVLDGYIARKTKTESELGARLDSIGDFILFAVITVSVILWLGSEILIFLPWIIIIVLVRCANIAITASKYDSFVILHTWGNKLTGVLFFAAPPLFVLYQKSAIFWPVCIAAVLSAAEETVIHLTSAKLNVNRRSIFKP